MPRMTRSHYNLIADATYDIIGLASARFLTGEQAREFSMEAARRMTAALAGTNSQFKADRFRERCLGIRGGR